jgi:hypothetical protein
MRSVWQHSYELLKGPMNPQMKLHYRLRLHLQNNRTISEQLLVMRRKPNEYKVNECMKVVTIVEENH